MMRPSEKGVPQTFQGGENKRVPGAPCCGTWTLNLSLKTWQQIAMISCWMGRFSRMGWRLEAIRWLRRTLPNQTLAVLERQRLCRGRGLSLFCCIRCGHARILFCDGALSYGDVKRGSAPLAAWADFGVMGGALRTISNCLKTTRLRAAVTTSSSCLFCENELSM